MAVPEEVSQQQPGIEMPGDAEGDDDFKEEDGELQDSEPLSSMRTENVSGLPMSSRGLTTQMADRENSHGIDAGQTSRVNLKEIDAVVVENRNKVVRSGTFSPRMTRSRKGVG
ncbi:hypothetical protein NE237_011326 [Protea cynaroides]|uniref:Uncharacterized protein n=1 Tax=Protea cynaroides TaxID=273540 RepID=A0A9Q0JY63_9MAGN|nr:hypothetical protein NE237_011326 [Protea cynaroides]